MSSRRLRRLAVVWVTVAAGLAFSTPASAAVTYDPETNIGFVDRADVRDAFGWTDGTLVSRTPDLTFDHEFWIDDTYSASCGAAAFAIVHHREFGRLQLAAAPASRRERGAAAAYDGKPVGFRIAGATAGISGTSVPPAAGQPCPQAEAAKATIDRVQLVSTTTGWALVVGSQDVRRELAHFTSHP